MTESTELIELPSEDTALATFTTPGGLDHYVEQVREKVSGTVYDMKIRKDREACAADAYKVTRTKTAIEKMGAALSAKYKEVPKQIDAQRREWNAKMDSLRDEVRKPLTDWEEAEERRVAQHRANLANIAGRATDVGGMDADSLRQRLAAVESVAVDESWEEFEAEAHRVKAKALEILNAALAERQKYEAEQAELAELRRKQAEQEQKDREAEIARQAAEKARADAEAKAQDERDAAAKREADAKAAADRAEQERAEAIERQKQAEARAEAEKLAAEQRAKDAAEAARQAEIKRQADAKAAEEAAQRKREADIAHKASINNAALAAFIENGLPNECAKQAVILIAKGLIPAIRIQY
ncbi:hypothetical protein NBV64_08965 [Alcaligenes sp. DN25]|uniref:hypothetical protein n=1 Tax=Alcaligenes TaxID=507 RepID=UPI00202DE782|nr:MULTISPECIES: hypothetical protein [Alcaligenes]URW84458.1 hypothetical protein NBV64_08965 [Alcaligenes sp. DN25]WEA69298.1 hypothetical protein PWH35_08990 [Alcaligenes faecalis]